MKKIFTGKLALFLSLALVLSGLVFSTGGSVSAAAGSSFTYTFEDGNRTNLVSPLNTGLFTIATLDGNSVLKRVGAGYSELKVNTGTYSNFKFSVDFKDSSVGQSLKFKFRQPTLNNYENNGYIYSFSSSGISVGRWISTTANAIAAFPDMGAIVTNSSTTFADKAWHNISATMCNNKLAFYYDGTLIGNEVITDSAYTSGYLSLESSATSGQYYLDNFKVEELTSDPLPTPSNDINYTFDDGIRNKLIGSNYSIASGGTTLTDIGTSNWSVLMVGNTRQYGNFKFNTRVKTLAGGVVVFSFRQQGSSTTSLGNIAYRLELRDSLIKFSRANSSTDLYNPVFINSTSVGMGDRNWHELEVTMYGSTLQVKFDSTIIGQEQCTDSTYSTGCFQVASLKSGTEFDYFKIAELSTTPFVPGTNISYNFDDSIRTNMIGSDYTILTENGNSVLAHTATPAWGVLKVSNVQYTNFVMSARVKSTASGTVVLSLLQQGETSDYLGNVAYRIELRDNEVRFSKAISSTEVYYKDFERNRNIGMADRGWHNISITSYNGILLFKFDDNYIGSLVSDSSYTQGYIQLASVNAAVEIDNFTITKLATTPYVTSNVSSLVNSLQLKTLITTFLSNTVSNVPAQVKNGSDVVTQGYLGTGMTVTADGQTYTVIIKGDLTGDGIQSVSDLVVLRNVMLAKGTLTSPQLQATTTGVADICELLTEKDVVLAA